MELNTLGIVLWAGAGIARWLDWISATTSWVLIAVGIACMIFALYDKNIKATNDRITSLETRISNLERWGEGLRSDMDDRYERRNR
jgi:hypothetical protein